MLGLVVGYIEQTLVDGERVIRRARLHWIIFAGPVFLLVIALAALSLVFVAKPANETAEKAVAGFGYVMLAIALIGILSACSYRISTEIAATTRRFVVKRGLIRRAVMEMHAGQLESVSIYQSVLGRLLGYGTVVVGGTGSHVDPVKNVAAPLLLRSAINRIGRPLDSQYDRRPSAAGESRRDVETSLDAPALVAGRIRPRAAPGTENAPRPRASTPVAMPEVLYFKSGAAAFEHFCEYGKLDPLREGCRRLAIVEAGEMRRTKDGFQSVWVRVADRAGAFTSRAVTAAPNVPPLQAGELVQWFAVKAEPRLAEVPELAGDPRSWWQSWIVAVFAPEMMAATGQFRVVIDYRDFTERQ